MKRTALLSFCLTLASAVAAHAQPTMIKKFDDWGVYSYSREGRTVCYLLTVPKTAQPAGVDHGRNFFVIGKAPGKLTAYEPQAIMGYDLKPGSRGQIQIGDRTFAMFAKGKSAWVLEESKESDVIEAMRSGSDMTIAVVSNRGTQTSYTYSLSGVTAALKQMSQCK